MARRNRKEIYSPDVSATFHCVNRCIRQALLFGFDPVTQIDNSHRKLWFQSRLALLSSAMGIDLLGFCVMSNHIHVILRTQPELAREWSPQEVVRRWLILFPPRPKVRKSTAHLSAEARLALAYSHAEAELLQDPQEVEELRTRLTSPSWFMKLLTEPMARIANKEDGKKGRFWEGRFKMHPLLDELAVLGCLMYVDLNPIRAGVADGIATSRHTSLFLRLQATVLQLFETLTPEERAERGLDADILQEFTQQVAGTSEPPVADRGIVGSGDSTGSAATSPNETSAKRLRGILTALGDVEEGENRSSSQRNLTRQALDEASRQAAYSARATWLSPLQITEQSQQQQVPGVRATNKGCLELTLCQYMDLMEWTGRMLKPGKPGRILPGAPSILQQLNLSADGWLQFVQGHLRQPGELRRPLARPESLEAEAKRRGGQWLQGISLSRAIFGAPEPTAKATGAAATEPTADSVPNPS